MTIREEIIQNLENNPFGCYANYTLLKECFNLNKEVRGIDHDGSVDYGEGDILKLDWWFSGVIQSLFYKPNHYFLILKGKDTGSFFSKLFPNPEFYMEMFQVSNPSKLLFEFLIGEFKCPERVHLDLCEQNNFRAWTPDNAERFEDGTTKPRCDKRLLSYCGTTEKWNNPARKNVIVLEVESIDWEKFNAIPKLHLWQEIFNKFK